MKKTRFRIALIAAFFASLAASSSTSAQASVDPARIAELLNAQVEVATSLGTFTLQLRGDIAPRTVENFLHYVLTEAYTDTLIHRSVPGFIIQGGGYFVEEDGDDFDVYDVPAEAPVVNEFNLSNQRGTVAMAKLGGDPDSATNQWFVNVADNSENLDTQNGGFTVFAVVVGDGMEVIDAINALERWNFGGAFTDVPLIDFDEETEFLEIEHLVLVRSMTVVDFFGLPPAPEHRRSSSWLGNFSQRHFDHESQRGWIQHDEHGWLYAAGRGYAQGIWFWDHIQQDWLWTRSGIYPFLYSNNREAWLYYERGGSPRERWFYSYQETETGWFEVRR
jgi:cyclophilin family peptidyl-prolyl cis-trans isomerase